MEILADNSTAWRIGGGRSLLRTRLRCFSLFNREKTGKNCNSGSNWHDLGDFCPDSLSQNSDLQINSLLFEYQGKISVEQGKNSKEQGKEAGEQGSPCCP